MLKYIPLGGVATTANKNLHVYETDSDILIVDVGAGFPEPDQLGVDVVVPDVDYLSKKRDKIRGIIVSHAHFDHYGALPYLLRDLGRPPIYTAQLPRGFIQSQLEEFNLLEGQSIHLIKDDTESFKLGDFTIYPYHINHSVPDALGLFIQTAEGNIVHNTDFKFDWTPVDNKLFDVRKLVNLLETKGGALCLLSDCLGAARAGYTMSERYIQTAFEREIKDAAGQVFITTLSTNINRMQQAIDVAIKYDRKVIPLGLSIDKNMEIARKLGFLDVPRGVIVSSDRVSKVKPHQRLFIATGAFGQKYSSMDRLSHGEHRRAKIKRGDVVIFSADPIPGVHDKVGVIIDLLTEAGARVVYSELAEDLHTSGHGSQGDLSMLAGIVQPKYFVPIGGTFAHMRAYSNLMEAMGFPIESVFELKEGQVLEFKNGQAARGKEIKTKDIFVDGSRVGDVGRVVLEDRQKLAENGIFVAIVKKQADGKLKPEVDTVSRGFVYMAQSEKLMDDAADLVESKVKGRHVKDWKKVCSNIEQELENLFYKRTKRRPMVISVLVDV